MGGAPSPTANWRSYVPCLNWPKLTHLAVRVSGKLIRYGKFSARIFPILKQFKNVAHFAINCKTAESWLSHFPRVRILRIPDLYDEYGSSSVINPIVYEAHWRNIARHKHLETLMTETLSSVGLHLTK